MVRDCRRKAGENGRRAGQMGGEASEGREEGEGGTKKDWKVLARVEDEGRGRTFAKRKPTSPDSKELQ